MQDVLFELEVFLVKLLFLKTFCIVRLGYLHSLNILLLCSFLVIF